MEYALEPWKEFRSCQERQGQVKMQFPASLSGGWPFRQRSSIISSPTIHQIGTSHVTGGPVAMRVSALTATNTKIYRIWSHGWCGVPAKRVLECVTIVTCFPGSPFSASYMHAACNLSAKPMWDNIIACFLMDISVPGRVHDGCGPVSQRIKRIYELSCSVNMRIGATFWANGRPFFVFLGVFFNVKCCLLFFDCRWNCVLLNWF